MRGDCPGKGPDRGRRSFRPPGQPLEPEDAAVHLRQAQPHSHHRPAGDRSRPAAGLSLPRQVVAEGRLVLFVGTKRQAKEAIEREAARCGMPYVSERWLGGTLTNYRTIRDRLKRLQELELMWLPAGENPQRIDMLAYMNTMLNEVRQVRAGQGPRDRRDPPLQQEDGRQLSRELTKIRRNLLGIREMNRLPDALVVIDPKREHIAVKEAQRMGVTTVALIDTDSDPDTVDLPIPGNDDSIRSIELILSKLADAVLEGRAALPPEQQTPIRPRPVQAAAAADRPTAAGREPGAGPGRRSVTQ